MAAFACFRHVGLRKTTMVDISKKAGVSRSTLYEYFADKGAVVEACAETASQRFYRNMAKVVAAGETLEEKLTAAAVFVVQARHVVETERYFDADEVGLLLTKNAAILLAECADFLSPHLAAAKITGEVRKDLDVRSAGEWYARILFSLFSTPSLHLDMNDSEAVAEFARGYAVRGFLDGRAGRPRRGAN